MGASAAEGDPSLWDLMRIAYLLVCFVVIFSCVLFFGNDWGLSLSTVDVLCQA